MELTNQEKINILLEQLQLPDEHQVYFENASLKRLDVFKQKKLWHFHIEINQTVNIAKDTNINICLNINKPLFFSFFFITLFAS